MWMNAKLLHADVQKIFLVVGLRVLIPMEVFNAPANLDSSLRMTIKFVQVVYKIPYYTYITGHVINANEPGRVN